MFGRNSVVKVQKDYLNTMQNISPENSLPLPKNPTNNKMISLIYDVNDHVYSKSNSVYLRSSSKVYTNSRINPCNLMSKFELFQYCLNPFEI